MCYIARPIQRDDYQFFTRIPTLLQTLHVLLKILKIRSDHMHYRSTLGLVGTEPYQHSTNVGVGRQCKAQHMLSLPLHPASIERKRLVGASKKEVISLHLHPIGTERKRQVG